MWRFVAGAVAALLLAAGGILWVNGRAAPDRLLAVAPPAAGAQTDAAAGLPETVPQASAKTREQRRFGRYDKDRDGQITREEYLAARRRAFAKLDVNGDGTLSFDEWATKATTKFATADADRSGAMNPAEFSTTAVKRTTRASVKCPPAAAPREEES